MRLFYEKLAEAQSQTEGTRFVGKALWLQEKQRASSARIRRAHGKTRKGGMIAVVAPNAQGEWVELSNRSEIKKAFLEENKSRSSQSTKGPLSHANPY